MKQIFQPFQVGSVLLKNRIVFAPASLGKAGVAQYEQLAKGGCGLIIIADLSILPSMLGAPSLSSMESAGYFRTIIQRCHQYGCCVSAQLFCPEYDVKRIAELYQKKDKHSPQEVRKALAESTETFCDTLMENQIRELVEAFRISAKHAADIGFDMIQIHGDRLVGSFTSSEFNHRKDEYGVYDRFASEVVQAVRQAAPKLGLDYKLTIRTETPAYGRGGICAEQVPEFVKTLENCGVDCFHVTLANHTTIMDTIPDNRHPFFQKEGCFAEFARLVKQHTQKPVCCVGKISNPETAETLCQEGMELIGMCRQLIADPDWVEKVKNKQEKEILCCTYCNLACVKGLMAGQPVSCILHQNQHCKRQEGGADR